jgi:hypothetical protein
MSPRSRGPWIAMGVSLAIALALVAFVFVAVYWPNR